MVSFRSADFVVDERFARWREQMAQAHAPMDLRSAHQRDYTAELRVLELGAVTVWPARFQALEFHRSPRLVRQSDPEAYHLSLVCSGAAEATWGKSVARYGADDFHVNVTSRPWQIRAEPTAPDGLISSVGMEIPRRNLPLDPRRAERAVGQRLSGRSGAGALLALLLTQLSRQGGDYRAADAPRLETLIGDLVAAMLAAAAGSSGNPLPPESRRRVLLLRIRAHIRRHLGDPGLCPASVAAAHHISVRYLHRLFEECDETVVRHIRGQRLAAARRDLADPAMVGVPVQEIGARWGYRHAAHFNRAFRTAYGLPPAAYRTTAAAPPPSPRPGGRASHGAAAPDPAPIPTSGLVLDVPQPPAGSCPQAG